MSVVIYAFNSIQESALAAPRVTLNSSKLKYTKKMKISEYQGYLAKHESDAKLHKAKVYKRLRV